MKNLDRSITKYYQKQQLDSAALEDILRESEQYRRTGHLDDNAESAPSLLSSLSFGSYKMWVAAGVAAALMLLITPLVRDRHSNDEQGQNTSLAVTPNTTGTNTTGTSANDGQIVVAGTGSQAVNQVNMSNIVMREASLNHTSQLKLDFKTDDFQQLSQSMQQLDFALELPERLQPVSVAREGEFSEDLAPQELLQGSQMQRLQLAGGRYCTVGGRLAAHVKLANSSKDEVSLFVTHNNKGFDDISNQSARFEDGVQVSSWNENGLFYLLVTNQ